MNERMIKMADVEIGLQDLIYQVKRELLAPNPAATHNDPYPLFAIEQIELEIAVKATQSRDGSVRLSVLDFAEVSAGGSVSRERGHVVRVTLSPIIPPSETAAELLNDPTVKQMIIRDIQRAIFKGSSGIVGEPE
jgi:hypothetical protein